MNFLLRLFLTLGSVSFFMVVYLVNNEITPCSNLQENYHWVVYIGYVSIPFILAWISLLLSKLLSKSTIQTVLFIEPSNNDFLANYLAFFFVALSVSGMMTFVIVFGMTVLFTFFSRVSYFNPIFLVFGYNFYYVTTKENVKIMLISKKKLKKPKSFESIEVCRINDYTFIESKQNE